MCRNFGVGGPRGVRKFPGRVPEMPESPTGQGGVRHKIWHGGKGWFRVKDTGSRVPNTSRQEAKANTQK